MLDRGSVVRRLRLAGYSVTRPRQAVIDAVVAQPGQFTANDVYAATQESAPEVGRATVFRTLEILERSGVVSRMHSREGCATYTCCTQLQHHHHLVCSTCGTVIEVPGCSLAEVIDAAQTQHGFAVEGHVLEIYGRCRDCQAAS